MPIRTNSVALAQLKRPSLRDTPNSYPIKTSAKALLARRYPLGWVRGNSKNIEIKKERVRGNHAEDMECGQIIESPYAGGFRYPEDGFSPMMLLGEVEAYGSPMSLALSRLIGTLSNRALYELFNVNRTGVGGLGM